ncbi:MAG: hypothetical protein V1891_01240 [bacterium]
MLIKEIFNKGCILMNNGQKDLASEEFEKAFAISTNKNDKLQIGLALVATLSSASSNKRIIEICDESLILAEYVNDLAAKAYLMGIKAGCLHIENLSFLYKQKNLKLIPTWSGFSLESESNLYCLLEEKINNNKKDAELLLNKAIKLCDDNNLKLAKGNIMLSKGSIYGQEYMHYKLLHQRPSKLFLFLRKYIDIELYVCFTKKEREQLIDLRKNCIDYFLKAVSIFEEMKDERNIGYAYFNLSNQLRMMNTLRMAQKYLDKSRVIIRKCNDNVLFKNIATLQESIKKRNLNIPDYIHGEKR